MRVLIVEDDPAAQLMLKSTLCKVADVTTSSTGTQGLQAFHSALKSGEYFDLVCLDIGLPEIDGKDLLRLIRKGEVEKSAKRSVVMIMSASNENDIVQETMDLGADGYLVKPVDRGALIARLKAIGVDLSVTDDQPRKLVQKLTALCARNEVPLNLLKPLLARIQDAIRRQTPVDVKPPLKPDAPRVEAPKPETPTANGENDLLKPLATPSATVTAPNHSASTGSATSQ
jgi:two-component system chemotaxis response regulator CheY